jgi:hypothetical protein
MAVKGGDLIHVGNQVLLDRAQTAGPGQVNIPTEKIYELGNYQSVGTILDIPDLSFPLESFDASAELESLLVGKDFAPTRRAPSTTSRSRLAPVDVASQFKNGPRRRPARSTSQVGVGDPGTCPWSSSPTASASRRTPAERDAQGRLDLLHPGLGLHPGGHRHQHRQPDRSPSTHKAYPYNGDVVERRPVRPRSVSLRSDGHPAAVRHRLHRGR